VVPETARVLVATESRGVGPFGGNTFPVVAIGSSAGGLEALSELVSALETKAGMAYVVVQHLSPEHKSLLSELLARKTAGFHAHLANPQPPNCYKRSLPDLCFSRAFNS
jgi:chemotaxis response regulator CheB